MRVLRAIMTSLPYLAGLVTVVGMANLFWYIGESLHFGGSALSGFVRSGHYYLSLHGSYSEVSQTVWEHIRLHEISVLLSVPLVVVCTWYWLVGHFFPSQMGFRRGEVVTERVRAVQASGLPLASGRCGGNVGGVGLTWPLFAVKVFPDGITVRVFPRQPVAILKGELTRVERLKRYGRLQITHRSPDIDSPVELYPMPWNDLTPALEWLVSSASVQPQGGSERTRGNAGRP